MGRPVEYLDLVDQDWLAVAQEDGKSWLKLNPSISSRFFVRRAHDYEIEEAEIDPSRLPEGKLIYALVHFSSVTTRLRDNEEVLISLYFVNPALEKKIEELNAAVVKSLYFCFSNFQVALIFGSSGRFQTTGWRNR